MAEASAAPGGEAYREWQAVRIAAWGRVLVAGVIVLLVVVLGRVVQLKVRPDVRLASAMGSTMSSRPEMGRRGDLVDRRGRLLATSAVGYRLFVDPYAVEDADTVALDIAAAIGADPAAIDQRILARPQSRYVVVDPLLDGWQVDAIRSGGLAGVGLEPRLVRHYMTDGVAAGLVGTVGFEHTGLSGLEHRFDRPMAPQPGNLVYRRDVGRRPLWIERDGYRPGRDGAVVRLSLDLVIQTYVEERLAEAVEAFNAGGGRLVVLDPRTGEIVALHDVLRARDGWEEQTTDPMRERDPALGRNRCATDPYEPGSTFKPFVWSVALERGRATMDEVLPTPEIGPHRTSYGRRIRDSHPHADSTWRTVLVKSMNSGMAIVAERMPKREMRSVVRRFGFGERTGCGLPGESPGIVTPESKWNDYTQTSVAMGHEISVTPVQMVRAFSAIARDGTIPSLRMTAPDPDEPPAPILRRAISADVARTTREVLRNVMLEGTGRRARSDAYELFGKSGTAQLPKKNGGGYHEDRYVSSFIAGAPFDDPRLVVLCVIDDPDRSIAHYGGTVAGPVVRDVIEHALEYMGVPTHEPQFEHDEPIGE